MNPQSQALIECVLNLSEGRNLSSIQDVSDIIEGVQGCRLMHRDMGWDAHRTVFTIVGGIDEVLEAIEGIIVYALAHFDIRTHQGIHPLVGILDVIPFVALEGISQTELRFIIHQFWSDISGRYKISLMAYGALSSDPSLMTLAYIRRGGVDGLSDRIRDGGVSIDYGPNEAHISQGIYCTTVRPIMVAYNINLDTKDMAIARLIARELRGLRKTDPRITDVRFLAWYMVEYERCQISTNIYDIHAISMLGLIDLISQISSNYDITVNGSEMIGMTPVYGLSHNLHTIEASIEQLGLNAVGVFNPEERLLDIALDRHIL